MKLRESLEALTQKWLKNGHSAFANSLHEAFDAPLSELEAELAAVRDREKAARQAGFDAGFDGAERAAFERERVWVAERAGEKAAIAAALRQVSQLILEEYWKIEVSQREHENGDGPKVIASGLSEKVLSLITPDQSAALAERKRKTEEILLRAMLIAQNFGTLKR